MRLGPVRYASSRPAAIQRRNVRVSTANRSAADCNVSYRRRLTVCSCLMWSLRLLSRTLNSGHLSRQRTVASSWPTDDATTSAADDRPARPMPRTCRHIAPDRRIPTLSTSHVWHLAALGGRVVPPRAVFLVVTMSIRRMTLGPGSGI